MSIAVCLLAYSLVVLVIGPPLLSEATSSGALPRLGITVWVAAMVSVFGAWLLAATLFAVDLARSWDHLDRLLAGCFAVLRALATGGYGSLMQSGLALLAAFTALVLGVLGMRVAAALRRARIHTRRHADAAHLATRGAPRGPGDALVVDAAHRSVYCLAGRPRTIVITRPALDALTGAEMEAVLAHEGAHLSGRHHSLLTVTGVLAKILPQLALFNRGHAEISQLAEMRADDVAAQQHTRDIVVDALLALVLPAGASPGSPAPALGAATLGVAKRVDRLLTPPESTRDRLRLALILGALMLAPLTVLTMVLTHSPLCVTSALG